MKRGAADFVPGDAQQSLERPSPGRHVLVSDMPGDSALGRYFVVR